MDIASLSRAMSDMSVRSAVDISLLKMSIDGGSKELSAVKEILSDVAQDPSLGIKIDVKV